MKLYKVQIKVICQDLHEYKPNEFFDIAIFQQSLCHLKNPEEVLDNLYDNVNTLLIVDFIAKKEATNFPNWKLKTRTKKEFMNLIQGAGYKLKSFKKISTPQSIIQSAKFWLENIEKLDPVKVYGHIASLKNLCCFILDRNLEVMYMPWFIGVFYAEKDS